MATNRHSFRSPCLILAATAALLACDGGGSDPGPGPDPSLGTIPENLSKGTAALETALATRSTDDFLEATKAFSTAADLVAAGATSSAPERDQARFFGALARIAVLAQPYSDLTPDGLDDLGDVLDAFGISTAQGARATFDDSLFLDCTDVYYYPSPSGPPYYDGQDCQLKDLAADSPRSGELQAFLANRVAAGLRSAVTLLEDVTDGFTFQLRDGSSVVELDKTDALFLTAVAQGMLAGIDLLGAYDLDVDLDELQADDASGAYTLQQFSEDYPLFLTLRNAAKLPQARANATDGIRSLQAAVQHLAAETDDQSDDLVRVVDEICTYGMYTYGCTTLYNPQQQIADLQAGLAEALAVATAAGTYRFDMGTADDSDDVVVDPGKFFAGLDLRALLPSTFAAGAKGDRPGLFPDSTFGGVLVSAPQSVNEDLDGDGSPDLFGYTYFGTWLQGRSLSAGWSTFLSGAFALAATGNGLVYTDWNRMDPVTYQYATIPGTWSYSTNVLTLALDAPLPNGVKTVVVTADRLDEWSFEGPTRYLAADGSELGSGYQYFWY